MSHEYRTNTPQRLLVVLAVLLLTACASGESVQPVAVGVEVPATAIIAATATPQPEPTATKPAAVEPILTVPTATPLPEAATPEATAPMLAPMEVTYFTPSQGEGPYYTVEKPADRDNDLVVLTGAAGTPVGEILDFGGRLYDGAGMPVAGAAIEIWQTDSNGVYLHPNDSGTSRRDVNFQFYGEAVTGEDGRYSFRTLYPGHYEPRPRHIHVKIKVDGQEMLTTQFYFDNDPALATDSLFANARGDQLALIMAVVEGNDASGHPVLLGTRDVVLRVVLSKP